MRAALGRPTGQPRRPSPDTAAAVDAALRALPSHGWTHGMFGRRDRCLLVLSQLAGVPYRALATVTAGDVTVADGTATIRTPAGSGHFVRPTTACCAGCARSSGGWRSCEVAATRVATAEVAGLLKTAPEVTGRSPHVCRTPLELAASTRGDAVVVADRPVGRAAVPAATVDPALAVPPGPGPPRRGPRRAPGPGRRPAGAARTRAATGRVPPPRPVYSRQDRQQAWARRRADLQELAGVTEELTDVDSAPTS